MLTAPTVLGFQRMPNAKPPAEGKGAETLRVRLFVKEGIDAIREATGQYEWQIVEELIKDTFASAVASAKAHSAKIKAEKAKVLKAQEEAKKRIWGERQEPD